MAVVQLSTKRSEVISVCEQCPECAYLQLKVPEHVLTVTGLTFTITSHDQGWSNNQDRLRGTYEAVFSYFEACVTTPTGHDRTRPRFLQSNRHAMHEPYTHVIHWRAEDTSLDLRAWLGSIQGGDYVQVVPQARHQGWKNHVYEMQIEATGIEGVASPLIVSSPLDPTSPLSLGRHYKALSSARQEIRLLSLLPGQSDDALCCEIHLASLKSEDLPRYETISYCWGRTDGQDEVTVMASSEEQRTMPDDSQCVIQIRKNLSLALRRLRPRRGNSRMLWVDAICIDQKNLSERAEQVKLMKLIYAKATRTIVWLGEEAAEDGSETENLLKAAHIAENYSKADGWEYEDPKHLHDPLQVQPEHFTAVDCPVFERSWFRRSWVVQEVVYSKAVSVQLGSHAVPWPLLLRMNRCISQSAWRPANIRRALMPALFNILFEADSCTGNVFLMSDTNPTNKTPMDVLDIVVQGADLDATDPRDKIFALVGLDLTEGIGKADIRIQPDYNKAVGRVFADFTRWWIVQHQSLRILSAIHVSVGRTWQKLSLNMAEVEGRTSWSFWSDGKSVWSRSTLGLWRSSRYRASANTSVDVALVDEETAFDRLRLRGCRISRIAAIRPFPYFRCLSTDELTPLRRVYEKLLEPSNRFKTWTAEASRHDLDINRAVELGADDPALGHHIQTHREYAVQNNGALECHPAVHFTTEEGGQGLCPPMASPGDLVVVLCGGNVPYILRERSMPTEAGLEGSNGRVQHSLVGECYLERYMYGWAVQQMRDANHARIEELFDVL